MTPANELFEYQLEVARRWLDDASAVGDRPSFDFVAHFSAFNAIYWLWAALYPTRSFGEAERSAVDGVLEQATSIEEGLRKRVMAQLQGLQAESKTIASCVQRLSESAAADVLCDSTDFIAYLCVERRRPIHRMDKRSRDDSVGDGSEGRKYLKLLGDPTASNLEKVKALAGTLYLIRCNLVHGSKVMHVEREEHALVSRALPALRALTRAVVDHCERNRPA